MVPITIGDMYSSHGPSTLKRQVPMVPITSRDRFHGPGSLKGQGPMAPIISRDGPGSLKGQGSMVPIASGEPFLVPSACQCKVVSGTERTI